MNVIYFLTFRLFNIFVTEHYDDVSEIYEIYGTLYITASQRAFQVEHVFS